MISLAFALALFGLSLSCAFDCAYNIAAGLSDEGDAANAVWAVITALLCVVTALAGASLIGLI